MFEDLKKGLYQTFILDDNYQYFIKGIQTTLIVTGFCADRRRDSRRDCGDYPFCPRPAAGA